MAIALGQKRMKQDFQSEGHHRRGKRGKHKRTSHFLLSSHRQYKKKKKTDFYVRKVERLKCVGLQAL